MWHGSTKKRCLENHIILKEKENLSFKQNLNQNTEFILLFSDHGEHPVRLQSTPITSISMCNKNLGDTPKHLRETQKP